ncbi:MAG: flagellar biosynthetic protein FliO [Thermodesulfovibrionales bacterium]|nr:flagellar biosynthetic protein FliO [Thermodesulfovibrionales bacterium]
MNIYLEFIKMIAALLVVLGLMFLMLKLLKHRIMPRGNFINMIHYQPIGTRRAIAVVKIANEYFALGLSEAGINVITKIETKEVENYLKDLPQDSVQTNGFNIKNLLSRLSGGRL